MGTSGWSYDEWVGPVYSSKDEPKLRKYSMFFNTVEIDSSFYTYPREETVKAMMRQVPRDFIFTAKAPQEVTHRRALDVKAGAVQALERFTQVMKPMNDEGMLGCILLQLSPSMRINLERLEKFLQEIDHEFRYAVEFRHESWMGEEAFNLLKRYKVAYVVVDEPLLPPVMEITSDFSYIRWHGRGSNPWYNYLYRRDELEPWKRRIEEMAEKTKTVYGYFNNHFHGYAAENALEILDMFGLLDEKRKRELERIKNNIDRPYIEKRMIRLDKDKIYNMDLRQLLNLLTDAKRFERGLSIRRDDVSIKIEYDDYITAKVKDYLIVIDPVNKILIHDCGDWEKLHAEKRICKHIVRVFTMMDRIIAMRILRDIILNNTVWRFEAQIN